MLTPVRRVLDSAQNDIRGTTVEGADEFTLLQSHTQKSAAKERERCNSQYGEPAGPYIRSDGPMEAGQRHGDFWITCLIHSVTVRHGPG